MSYDPRMAAFLKAKSTATAAVKTDIVANKVTDPQAEAAKTDSEPADTSDVHDTDSGKSFTGPGAKLISITKKLTALIIEETSYLRDHKTQTAATLHGEKSRLMAEYKKTLNHIQVNEHLLGPKESSLRQFIRKITDRFRDALKEHARIVLRMKSISEGIIKSIGDEVTKYNKPVAAYGANAAMTPPQKGYTTSISLNKVI